MQQHDIAWQQPVIAWQQQFIAWQQPVIARVCLIRQDRREALVGALVFEFEFFFAPVPQLHVAEVVFCVLTSSRRVLHNEASSRVVGLLLHFHTLLLQCSCFVLHGRVLAFGASEWQRNDFHCHSRKPLKK